MNLSQETNSRNFVESKNELEKFIKECKKKMRIRKKPINNIIINYFYESPQKFFTQYKKSLKYSSYFDICGNSFFIHYFYFLYEEYKFNKRKFSKNDLINNRILSNINIYLNNFDQFFEDNKKYLLIKDLHNETSLHKIAKFNDKAFFIKIFLKLNQLGILNDNLLSIKNINNETCCDYIFEEIKNKYEYYIYKNEHVYNLLKNFITIIKINYYTSIFQPLSIEMKI